ncbi:MAG: glycoside hydrolase N-terminal domain-containing protein [bacterium]
MTNSSSPDPVLASLGVTSIRHSVVSDVPATSWDKAMVSGNGIQGAMAMGRVPDETIVLNHAGLFIPLAAPFPTVSQAKILPELRRMIEEGMFQAAADRVVEYSKEEGKNGDTWTDPFVPACSLKVTMPSRGTPRGYLRSTDFLTGVTGTRWEDDAGLHVRRLFVSKPDNLIVLSLTGINPVDCDLKLVLHDPELDGAAPPPGPDAIMATVPEAAACEDWGRLTFRIVYTRRWPGSLQGCEVAARVIATGGNVTAVDGGLTIRGATDVLVILRTELSYNISESRLPALCSELSRINDRYDSLLAQHAAIHGEIMSRCQLDLGGTEADHRLTAPALFANSCVGRLNTALLEKEFDACRYLVLSSSGPEYPPTLQGIWGATWKPDWSSDYTQNGNLQTVVAGNLPANIPEAMNGFFRYLESQLPDYRDNAMRLFGARGANIPHRTSAHGLNNRWEKVWPMTFWTAGAAWNAQFFYDYWLTTGNKEFLLNHALPWMKEAAVFFEDFFYPGPDGKWVSNPSYSPENEGANTLSQSALNSTMDFAAARELLTNLVAVCSQLGIESGNVARWKTMLAKMPEYMINSDGAIAEWITPLLKDSYDHRHASHLYGLYAGLPADIASNPVLQTAFKVAFDKRMEWRRSLNGADMAFGLCQLGWAAASLRLADDAYETVDWLANNFWFAESMVTSHNVRSIFNVDLAGGLPRLILQMLVQDRPGQLDLLPALPKRWKTGCVTGVLCRGQLVVRHLEWYPESATVVLYSAVDQTITLRIDGMQEMAVADTVFKKSGVVILKAGKAITLKLRQLAHSEDITVNSAHTAHAH